MAQMGYSIPLQYMDYYCPCGKKLKYSTSKQLKFVLAQHKTSNRHRRFTGWPLNEELDPLRDYELPSFDLLNNEEFEKQLRQVLL